MFVDARSLPAEEQLDADLCIVGAGAAGIVLAATLAGVGRRIILVESGDLAPDPATQDLYRGLSVGLPYAIVASRLRYFGGTTNHWQGACRPLDVADLAAREWVPRSGWPFPRSVLDPYYARARPLCDLAPTAAEARGIGCLIQPASRAISARMEAGSLDRTICLRPLRRGRR